MKKKLCLVYQLFTKCNINCKYCYNYFDQDILPYNYYTSKVEKLLELYHEEACFVLNGGEPLLLKGFHNLVNLATKKAKTYTYTNGTLSTLHYIKFIERLENINNFYMTLSLHCMETMRDGKLPVKYFKNINAFTNRIPNTKINLIIDENFHGEFLANVNTAFKEIKEKTSLKFVNILIADHLYQDEIKLMKILNREFKEFVLELDRNFIYKNCMWDNTRKSFIEMYEDILENTKLKYTGKQFKIPYEHEFIQINFLESSTGMVVEEYITDEHKHHLIPYDEFDKFIETIKPIVHSRPLRKIKTLSSVGII